MPEWAIELLKLAGAGVIAVVLKGLYDLKFKKMDDRATLQTLLAEQVTKLKQISDSYQDDSDDYRGKYWDERRLKHEANERAQIYVWKAIEMADILEKMLIVEECLEKCVGPHDIAEAKRLVERIRAMVDKLSDEGSVKLLRKVGES